MSGSYYIIAVKLIEVILGFILYSIVQDRKLTPKPLSPLISLSEIESERRHGIVSLNVDVLVFVTTVASTKKTLLGVVAQQITSLLVWPTTDHDTC